MFINLNSNEILSINKWQYNKVRVCKTYQTNKTMSNGGGVNATGGTIENCIIKGNTATNGSGIYARGEMMIKIHTFQTISTKSNWILTTK